ncbi:MAG: response regulator transcription factor [Ardenticatenaceae bacterium]|nr:response regulator transcription factor [Ardenticatenaceae bacterium]MCB9446431.1 response regulator transcription factor [Ardenticatenaceae bacterium]
MSGTIRVLIADDHTVVRKGIRTLLLTEPGLEVVGEAVDGVEAAALYRALLPDVLLLDLQMPRRGGLEVITELKNDYSDVHILVLTSSSDEEAVVTAVQNGALGYLMKDSTPEELVEAIHAVHHGRPFMQPSIAFKMMQALKRPSASLEEPLTDRENDILRHVAHGLSNQEIADLLTISERTVRTHISHILDKLSLENRTQAALYALRHGLTSLDEP